MLAYRLTHIAYFLALVRQRRSMGLQTMRLQILEAVEMVPKQAQPQKLLAVMAVQVLSFLDTFHKEK
jgi:hypothetical protein